MTAEEIQQKCREIYTEGVKYICPVFNQLHTVDTSFNDIYNIIQYNDSKIAIDAGITKGFFYYNGNWAQVVSTSLSIESNKKLTELLIKK